MLNYNSHDNHRASSRGCVCVCDMVRNKLVYYLAHVRKQKAFRKGRELKDIMSSGKQLLKHAYKIVKVSNCLSWDEVRKQSARVWKTMDGFHVLSVIVHEVSIVYHLVLKIFMCLIFNLVCHPTKYF